MTRKSMGEFEHFILLAVLRLGEDAYGVPIIEELEARTGREISQAATYIALKRMQEKGWLKSCLADPLPERGGRSRRYYTVTEPGRARLRESGRALFNMWEGLEAELRERLG